MVTAFVSPSRWLRVALPAALVLCVMAMGAGRAEASCGDWLEGHVAMDAADVHAVAPAGVPATGALRFHLPGKRPCNGPSCGRAPHVPSAPSEAPTTALDLERDAILVLTPVDASTAPRSIRAIDDLAPLSALCGRLDRPPKGV